MPSPRLAGVTLRAPSSHSRVPAEVSTEVQLADGSTASYSQGFVMVWSLTWELTSGEESASIERLGMLVGPQEYVDIDGTVWVVTVSDRQPREAIRGTDPIRYGVGLTLQEHTPRQVPPPEPTPVAPVEVGPLVAEVDPLNSRVLLVYAGAPDPGDPAVLVWTV